MSGLPAKPPKGAACNGCGVCCLAEPCQLAQAFLHVETGPCPALEYADGRTYCGIVRRPAHYLFGQEMPQSETGRLSVALAEMLGLGHGCDADDEPASGAAR